ncbi:MAG: GtrA family protein [Gammaproteobacteria bacterium]|nr:GtrA family protein [Gammaproteobacteria bacterium]
MNIIRAVNTCRTVVGRFLSRQFGTFLVTGGIAAAVNFFSRIFYSRFVSFPFAVTLAYLTGMVIAFALARRFVFPGTIHSTGKSALLFGAVNIVGFLLAWTVSMVLAYYVLPHLGIQYFSYDIASFFGIMVPAFSSYFGHKYISLKQSV